MRRPREHWGTRLGIILAVAGSAVGLGNFLRFPGLAAEHGGAAFMVPYFISFLILGIPICWCEWTLGRYGGTRGFNSAPGIFRAVCGFRGSEYFGVLALILPMVIYMYYVYIESWCLAYAFFYLRGALSFEGDIDRYGEFFASYVGIAEDGAVFSLSNLPTLGFLLLAFGINFYIIYRGLTRGIELFCKIAMPILIFAAVLVLIRVLTLQPYEGRTVLDGLGFMWNPKIPEGGSLWAAINPISHSEAWLAASGQVFFSLSVGFGIVLTYSSYLRRNDDLVLSGLTSASTNQFCEVCLAGLITVPAAFLFLGATPVREAAGSTLSLGFFVFPAIFEYMPMGWVFGFLWFFLLFLGAVTSSISMLQPSIAFLEEGFDLGRKASALILACVTSTGVLLVLYFSAGLTALDTMDFWVGTFLIFILAMIEVIVFGWVFGVDRGMKEARRGALISIPWVFRFIIKYVSPAYLLVVFVLFLRNEIHGEEQGKRFEALRTDTTVQITVGFIFVLITGMAVLIFLASRRWDKKLRERESWEEV